MNEQEYLQAQKAAQGQPPTVPAEFVQGVTAEDTDPRNPMGGCRPLVPLEPLNPPQNPLEVTNPLPPPATPLSATASPQAPPAGYQAVNPPRPEAAHRPDPVSQVQSPPAPPKKGPKKKRLERGPGSMSMPTSAPASGAATVSTSPPAAPSSAAASAAPEKTEQRFLQEADTQALQSETLQKQCTRLLLAQLGIYWDRLSGPAQLGIMDQVRNSMSLAIESGDADRIGLSIFELGQGVWGRHKIRGAIVGIYALESFRQYCLCREPGTQ